MAYGPWDNTLSEAQKAAMRAGMRTGGPGAAGVRPPPSAVPQGATAGGAATPAAGLATKTRGIGARILGGTKNLAKGGAALGSAIGGIRAGYDAAAEGLGVEGAGAERQALERDLVSGGVNPVAAAPISGGLNALRTVGDTVTGGYASKFGRGLASAIGGGSFAEGFADPAAPAAAAALKDNTPIDLTRPGGFKRPTTGPGIDSPGAQDLGPNRGSVIPTAQRQAALGPSVPGENAFDREFYSGRESANPNGGFNYRIADQRGQTGTVSTERTRLGANIPDNMRPGGFSVVPAGGLRETPNTAAAAAGYDRVIGLDGKERLVKRGGNAGGEGGGLADLLGGGASGDSRVNVIRNTSNTGFGSDPYSATGGPQGALDRDIKRMLNSNLSPGRKADLMQGLKAINQRREEAALDRETALEVAGIRGAGRGKGAGGADFGDLLNLMKFNRDIQRDSVTDARNARIDARDEARFGVDTARTAREDERAANETLSKSLGTAFPTSGDDPAANARNRALGDRVLELISTDPQFEGQNLTAADLRDIGKDIELSGGLNRVAQNQSGVFDFTEEAMPRRRSLADIKADLKAFKEGKGYRGQKIDLKTLNPFRDELTDDEYELYSDRINR